MSGEVKDPRPPPPEWMDKDLIQTALRNGGGDPSITVISCDIRLANPVGDGYGSDMYRVIATFQDNTQCSVIVKCHPQGGFREKMMIKARFFDKETQMLTKTLPAMYNLLEEACPGEFKPFSARCLHHGSDPIPFLVIEDLRPSGFTLAKRQLGLDLDHTSLAIKTLARFHAASMALYDQDPAAIECYDQGIFIESLREDSEVIFENARRSLEEQVASWPGYEKHLVKLREIKETYFDKLIELCRRKEDGYNCLIHADPWTSNMMFKYPTDGVVDLRLVDFQTAHYSSPALDLQYFLHSVPSEDGA